MVAWVLRASTSVSTMTSGVTVPGDGVAGTSAATGAALEVDLVRLADLDLLDALDLLGALARLEALAAGALGAAAGASGAAMPLVVTAIGARGGD